MADNLLKGIVVNDETTLVDEIDRVGPGGNYLDSDITLQRFREFWFPSLLDRQRRLVWQKKGATTMGERLNAKVLDILENHRPKPLEPKKRARVQEILATAK
jgi:trimethylamine---corrinoid protein Co-methyltransferase